MVLKASLRLLRLGWVNGNNLRDDKKHATSHMAIASPLWILFCSPNPFVPSKNAATHRSANSIGRSLLRVLRMQTLVELPKYIVIDQIQRHSIDDKIVRAIRFRRKPTAVHRRRGPFSAILHPDTRTMIWPRTVTVLDHRILKAVRRGGCEFNQFVKEILWMSFYVAEGDLQRCFGWLCSILQGRQSNGKESYHDADVPHASQYRTESCSAPTLINNQSSEEFVLICATTLNFRAIQDIPDILGSSSCAFPIRPCVGAPIEDVACSSHLGSVIKILCDFGGR